MRPLLRPVKRLSRVAPQIMLTSMIDMFTILLVFLLISHTDIDLTPNTRMQLPLSTAARPPEFAIKVTISKEDLSLDDKVLAPINNGRIHPALKTSLIIVPLYDALQTHAARRQELLKTHPEMSGNIKEKIIVVADETTPASLLDEVFYTISQQDFLKFHLLVLQKSESEKGS
jgi:biopolymer transport protein ExbD